MRIYMLVLTIIVVFSASEVFGMGKSDGSKEEVKSSVSEPAPAAAPKPAPIATPKAAPVRTPRAARVAPPKAVGVASPAPKTVLVTVNGIVIRQSDVNKEVAPQKSRMAAGGRPIPDSMVKQMEQRVVQMLVEKQIIKDKVASEGVVITDAQIQTEAEAIAKKRGMSVEEFEKTLLERGGISKADFHEQMRLGLGFEVLMKKAMRAEGGAVTEADAKAYYDSNIQKYTHEAQAKASHILVKGGTDEASKAVAKAEADKLLKLVKDGGDFAELAKAHSSCPSSAEGGDLGYFEKGRMVPEFSEAAFSMKVGEVSDLVETQFGYHIIKLTDMKAAGTSTFEEEKENIVKMLESGKEREFAQKYIAEVKSKAKIKWTAGFEPMPATPPMR